MITINADKYAVTIKEGEKVVSFPIGSFIVRRVNTDEIDFISHLDPNRFKVKMNDIVPRPGEFKDVDPTEKDDKSGKEGDIWHNGKTDQYYLHNGKKYTLTSKPKIMELYIHELSRYLNGAENFKTK